MRLLEAIGRSGADEGEALAAALASRVAWSVLLVGVMLTPPAPPPGPSVEPICDCVSDALVELVELPPVPERRVRWAVAPRLGGEPGRGETCRVEVSIDASRRVRVVAVSGCTDPDLGAIRRRLADARAEGAREGERLYLYLPG